MAAEVAGLEHMYKSASRFQQKDTRSSASVLRTDKSKRDKNNKPLRDSFKKKHIKKKRKRMAEIQEEMGGAGVARALYPIVKMLFSRKIRHPLAIAQILNRSGYRCRGKKWTPGKVERLIALLIRKERCR